MRRPAGRQHHRSQHKGCESFAAGWLPRPFQGRRPVHPNLGIGLRYPVKDISVRSSSILRRFADWHCPPSAKRLPLRRGGRIAGRRVFRYRIDLDVVPPRVAFRVSPTAGELDVAGPELQAYLWRFGNEEETAPFPTPWARAVQRPHRLVVDKGRVSRNRCCRFGSSWRTHRKRPHTSGRA